MIRTTINNVKFNMNQNLNLIFTEREFLPPVSMNC